MSAKQTRARKRRRRLQDELIQAIRQAPSVAARAARAHRPMPGHGEVWRALRAIERSELSVWQLTRGLLSGEDEQAMITQVVAPALAGMMPGNIHERRKRGE